MLTNLQAVRALAALAVVIFHFGLLPPTSLPFKVGAAGVDLFFVLSGFIIAYSSARSSRHFLAHRLIRVLPAYWLATFIAALFTLQNMDLNSAFGWLIQSLLYLPGPGGRPVLIFVAWTLVYELAFYLLYWLALRFGTRSAPFISLGLLLVLAIIHLPGLPGPWPLLLEFGMGISIYLLTERYPVFRSVPGHAGLVIAGIGVGLLLILPQLTGYNPDDYQSIGRVLSWGLPAGAIILGLVIADHGGYAVRRKAVLNLGAASYAIYLLHPVAIGQLLQLQPIKPPFSWLACISAVGVVAALSVAFHLLIEKPLMRWMRGLLGDRVALDQLASTEAPAGVEAI